MVIHTPTLQLLRASILVALSGVFRIYIASLFLGIAPSRWIYLAGFLVIYATYTLDRALGCEEDKINKKELASARKDIALILCLISLATGSFLFFRENLLLVAFLPFIIGYIYSKGIHIGCISLKLKGNFGVKNLTVSLTWGAFISGVVQHWAGVQTSLLFIFPFFAVKSFINTVIYDFRDVKGDAAAGIKTLPICLGDRKTRLLLQAMHNILHLWIVISMLMSFIKVEAALLMTLWLAGMVYTYSYTRPSPENEPKIRKIMRDLFVDGEFILAVSIKAVTGF
jgi:4-hydroxybenzoate polyprenyltransferase